MAETIYILKVKPEWLKACGHGPEWGTLEGTMRQGRVSASPMGACFDAVGPDGRSWVIFADRLTSYAVKENPAL
jgi:hypothetical protein